MKVKCCDRDSEVPRTASHHFNPVADCLQRTRNRVYTNISAILDNCTQTLLIQCTAPPGVSSSPCSGTCFFAVGQGLLRAGDVRAVGREEGEGNMYVGCDGDRVFG